VVAGSTSRLHVQKQGRSQCQYIAYWGLPEEVLVLPIELAWTFVFHLEGCARSIKFLCEHLLPCCMEPKLICSYPPSMQAHPH
jgi:hypothetical protein